MGSTLYSANQKQLIEHLIKARNELKFMQKKVAELLNKTQSYVSKIESGQRRVDIVQLKQFAKTYKKELNFFIKK